MTTLRRSRPAPSPAACLALAAALAACGSGAPAPETVARVGGAEVSYAAFTGYVEAETGGPAAALEGPVLSRLLDQYLTERLLVRLAVERGLVEPRVGHRQALSA
ncbi:MAG TPA: hypothetical protein VJG13_14395, partial [Thermoanaerobaculia bacterium]|nr:hypothetical protein [Thermoanaerobaculia bacterium]